MKKLFYVLPFLLLALILVIKHFFLSISNSKDEKSENPVIDDVIFEIDNAINKLGTFDKHHLPIFHALQSLTGQQLIQLHNDFGYRTYNPITGYYGVPFIPFFKLYRKKNLNNLFETEFSDFQIKQLKLIYQRKGLTFPYLSGSK